MIKSVKIRLKPTKEQEILMCKSTGIARFSYNWGLNKQEENYNLGNKFIPIRKLRDEFVALKKQEEYIWLNEVSAKVIGQAFEDLQTAYNNFFKGLANKPQFKSKRKSKASFFARYDAIKFTPTTVQIEKIGKINYSSNYEIPQLAKYTNPRVSFDGKYWYLSLGWEQVENINDLTGESIGIDVGIKDLASVSNIEKPIKNINKSKKVKKLKKKLKQK